MIGNRQKQKRCEIGHPCGFACVPRSHKCRRSLTGAAKVAVQWLTNIASNLVKKGKGYLEKRKQERQRIKSEKAKIELERLKKEQEELKRQKEIQKNKIEQQRIKNASKKQELRDLWEEKVADKTKARSLSGLEFDERMDEPVLAGTSRKGTPIENQVTSFFTPERFFYYHDIDEDVVNKAIDDYLAKSNKKGNREELLKKVYDFRSGRIDYSVNGSSERISVGESDEGNYTRKDLERIGLKSFRLMKKHLDSVPDGAIIHCTFYDEDGAGEYRKRIYNKIGFGEPIEDLVAYDDDIGKYQFAIKKDGKLRPLNKSQLFTEIIESYEMTKQQKTDIVTKAFNLLDENTFERWLEKQPEEYTKLLQGKSF